jgi:adenylosuccinate synthase
LNSNITAVIGNGCAVDPNALMDEIDLLEKDHPGIRSRIVVSNRAHLTTTEHRRLDDPNGVIGSTKKGIGPTYTDKIARQGIRAGSIESYPEFVSAVDRGFVKLLANTSKYINDVIDQNKGNVLCESAQGTMLDIDHGIYPFVTSSSSTAGGACTGLGIGPTKINGVIGVFKAYNTKVGNGPFVGKMNNRTEEDIRQLGNEFGSTTGRPRQCGWLDMPAMCYAARINGVTELAISKLDVLNGLINVPVVDHFEGWDSSDYPDTINGLIQAKPVYKFFDSWEGVSGQTKLTDLPVNARKFLDYLEEKIQVKFSLISTGKDREEMIQL